MGETRGTLLLFTEEINRVRFTVCIEKCTHHHSAVTTARNGPILSSMDSPITPVTSSAMPVMPTGSVRYAGFWLRFIAYVVDALLLAVVTGFVNSMVGGNTAFNPATSELAVNWTPATVVIVIGWLYYALMESSEKQGTLGKMILGLRVTDLTGKRIDFLRATGRHFAKILSALLLCIGYLMIAFTARKQGLHDMMAGTLVVRK